MSFRKQFKNLQGRFKETVGHPRGPTKSTNSSLGGSGSPPEATTSPQSAESQSCSSVNPEEHLPSQATPDNFLLAAQNPETPIRDSWTYFDAFRRILDGISGEFGPLKSAMEELGEILITYEDAANARKDFARLRDELEGLFHVLSTHFAGNIPPMMTTGMRNLCVAIESEISRISSKEERRLGRRYLEASKDLEEVVECYRRVQGHLERLKLNADLSMWRTLEQQAAENLLNLLGPSMSACYNSVEALHVGRRECTPETRKQVLADLSSWRHNKKQDNMFWLNGMAGTGKTTIASSLCAMLDRVHELGASFFCSRLLPECRNARLILPTIAYQLARFSRPFYHALVLALQADPDLHTKALPSQMDGLIIAPLRQAAHALPEHLVVVIDALDECEGSEEVGSLLEILARTASSLPLKIFVASRPEPQIRQKIGDTKLKLILHELEESVVKEDIKLYLETEFQGLSTPVCDTDLAILVERAGVLFIFAATVVRYIKTATSTSRRQKRLRAVLDADASGSLTTDRDIDLLYNTILDSAFHNAELEDDEKLDMKLVLDTVVCSQEPLTVNAIAGLLFFSSVDSVRDAIEPLWSVLRISGGDDIVTTLHASFSDYMLDSTRSKNHRCQVEEHHGRLAELCFSRFECNKRQFNVCSLESSHVFDDQIPDLQERVRRSISRDLSYASRYWAIHLELGGPSLERQQLVNKFVTNHLLLWMEVLNLEKQISAGAPMLEKTRVWCKEGDASQDMEDLVHDAWRFVTMFATNNVSRSTPHLYLSMLACWPVSGSLAGYYMRRTRGLAKVGGAGITRRRLALLSVLHTGGKVCSIACSADGMRIVSGSEDKTIRVWDAQTGRPVIDPIKGHVGVVRSVTFSPDGMRIVSGSDDTTVQVWDSQAGKLLLSPFQGHNEAVWSVQFSPDGMRIVSGSLDETLCIWDSQTGKLLLGPIKGHSNSVFSVGFSPDGKCIVSGSSDRTIRVWDAQTGDLVFDPLQGHSGSILSVKFSPNGMRIVSGSEDNTIRVWDARTGKSVLGPLEGHTGSVFSVGFSSDSLRICSGADDKTIRLWDAQTGIPVTDPLKGHIQGVDSVMFSPDGMRIVSGSVDKTIRVWDSQVMKPTLPPLPGHTDTVFSVAFSPDGASIASGSKDQTIYLWDAQSAISALGRLQGHTGCVRSIAFSPNSGRIVSGSEDGTIRVWDLKTGKTILELCQNDAAAVMSALVSPDGKRIISGSYGGMIQFWDAEDGKPVPSPTDAPVGIISVVVSPDGMHVASGSSDGVIRMWNTKNRTQVLALGLVKGHTGPVWSIGFSPDGARIVSGSEDQTIRLWDVETAKLALEPLQGHTGLVVSVAFSPSGAHIVSGSQDCTIRLWDAQNGNLVFGPLTGHTNSIVSVRFSPDGTRLVSGSGDGTIRVWNLRGGKQIIGPVRGGSESDKLLERSSDDAFIEPNSNQPIPVGRGDICVPMHKPALVFFGDQQDQSSKWAPFDDTHPWQLNEHGWVLDENQQLLLWLPPDLRDRLVLPNMSFIISTEGSIELDFEGAKLGDSWTESYIPAACT